MKEKIEKIKQRGNIAKHAKTMTHVLIVAGFFYRVAVLLGLHGQSPDASRGILGKHMMLVLTFALYWSLRKKGMDSMRDIVLIGIGIANVLAWCGVKTSIVLGIMMIFMLVDIVRGTISAKKMWRMVFTSLCAVEVYSVIMMRYFYVPNNLIYHFFCSAWSDFLLFIIVLTHVLVWEDGVAFEQQNSGRSTDN